MMKMTMKMHVAATFLATLPFVAVAGPFDEFQTEYTNGYTWTYCSTDLLSDNESDTVAIFKIDWEDEGNGGWSGESTTAVSPLPTGAVTIPAMLGGKPVTHIGAGAFLNCNGLTSVTIPDSITNINPDGAFEGCTSLRSFVVADANPCYVASSGLLLTKDAKTLVVVPGGLANVTIPDGVTCIGDEAFFYCSILTSVTIPNGVTSIGDWAFCGCSKLTGVTIPASVTSLGTEMFEDCSSLESIMVADGNPRYRSVSGLLLTKDERTLVAVPGGLTNVTIPNSVTSIGSAAFVTCCGLKSLMIPSGVTDIGGYAFLGCSGLTSVAISSSVTSIGEGAFDETALETVHVEVDNTDRVKAMLRGSGCDVSSFTFVEDVVPSPVTPDPVTPGYEVLEATDIVTPYEAPKAVTLQGVVYDGGVVVGIVELKLGRVNAKKGTGKVSGSVMTLDGKAHKLTAFNLAEIDGTTPKSVSLDVKDFGTMLITIGGVQFAGSMGKYHVQSADVGGDWGKGASKVYLNSADTSFPTGTLEDLLPNGEPIIESGGKWKFAKAASVKWARPKKGATTPEIYDEVSGKGLVVDTSGDKTNLSGMKLTYTPKKGTFKGSFKVYALEGSGKATKLKKYTVKVSGVVVDGVGYGTATCKTPAASWSVLVR